MKVLKKFEFKKQVFGARQKYQWDNLLDGDTYFMVQGEDFTGKLEGFMQLAKAAAEDRGKGLRVVKHKETDKAGKESVGVVLQAYEPETDEEKERIAESKEKRAEQKRKYAEKKKEAKNAEVAA